MHHHPAAHQPQPTTTHASGHPMYPPTRHAIHLHKQLVQHTRRGGVARGTAAPRATPAGNGVNLIKEHKAGRSLPAGRGRPEGGDSGQWGDGWRGCRGRQQAGRRQCRVGQPGRQEPNSQAPSPPLAHLAVSNTRRTAASLSPSHFCRSSGPRMLRKLAPQRLAAAFASSVLPQPAPGGGWGVGSSRWQVGMGCWWVGGQQHAGAQLRRLATGRKRPAEPALPPLQCQVGPHLGGRTTGRRGGRAGHRLPAAERGPGAALPGHAALPWPPAGGWEGGRSRCG